MGQFHPDFESDKISGDLQSVEAFFLGKKAYCDKLSNEKGEIDYHLRLKGIPNNLLESEYEDPLQLYKFMYEGGEYKFNLLTKSRNKRIIGCIEHNLRGFYEKSCIFTRLFLI